MTSLRVWIMVASAFTLTACLPDTPPRPMPADEIVIEREKYTGDWIEEKLGGRDLAFTLRGDGTVFAPNDAYGHISNWRDENRVLYLTFSYLIAGKPDTEIHQFPITCVADYGCRIDMGDAPIWHYVD